MNCIGVNVVCSNQTICISNILKRKKREVFFKYPLTIVSSIIDVLSNRHTMQHITSTIGRNSTKQLYYQDGMARVACKIHNRFFQICLYFCWCPSSFNSPNNFMHIEAVGKIRYSRHVTSCVYFGDESGKQNIRIPVTLILLWNPKNTTGWRGVKARWTSVSGVIWSNFFSGECNTQVCSASKSQERIVPSYRMGYKQIHV